MAEYYSDYGSKRGENGRRSWLMTLVDLVMTILSLVAGVLLVLTYLVPFIHPESVWFFPVLGLVAPGVYLACVLLTLYWIVRWRVVRAGVMLLVIVPGIFEVSLFYKPQLRRDYGEPSYDRSVFKVMTCNVRNFYGDNGRSSVEDFLKFIQLQDPDIICLQEYNARLAESSAYFPLLIEKYDNVAVGRTQAPDSLYGAPLVIYSKFPVIRSGAVLSPRESVWVDLQMDDDTVRIFNNHLRSTAIKASDDDFITNHRYLSDSTREDRIRSIVGRFRENSVLRASQVDSIARKIDATRYRSIVCGDFNDTPMSYVYRTMAEGLNDAFRESGSGYSHTFRGFFNTLRIDYVLSSEGFENISYEVPEAGFSDHLPVVVRLKKVPVNN